MNFHSSAQDSVKALIPAPEKAQSSHLVGLPLRLPPGLPLGMPLGLPLGLPAATWVATKVATRDASRVARSPANEKEEPEVKEYGSRQGTSVGRLLQFPDLIALLNTFLVIMC